MLQVRAVCGKQNNIVRIGDVIDEAGRGVPPEVRSVGEGFVERHNKEEGGEWVTLTDPPSWRDNKIREEGGRGRVVCFKVGKQ